MKLFKYCLPFAALALLASCSDNNLDAPEGGEQAPEVSADGSMYMTINVALPTGIGTKASLEGYDEGTEDEYAVDDMTLYVFKLTNGQSDPDATATFIDKIEVGFSNPMGSSDKSDVTGTYKATFQVNPTTWGLDQKNNPTNAGDTYWGLLVVNKPDGFTEPSATAPSNTLNGWNEAAVLSAQKNNPVKIAQNAANHFTMTNAPLVEGTDSYTVTTLTEIDPSNFALSPQQATESAADFYVQRIVAKLTVTVRSGNDISNVEVVQNSTDKVSIDAWVADVTNLYSYAVQNVEEADTWLAIPTTDNYFIDASGNQGLQNHLWWGIDPNYKLETGESVNTYYNNGFNVITDASAVTYLPNESVYCLENTMDYDNMIKNQTTRIIFKATYKPGGTALTQGTDAGIIVFNDKAMVVKTEDLKSDAPESGNIALEDLIDNSAEKKYYVKKTITTSQDPEGTTEKVEDITKNDFDEAVTTNEEAAKNGDQVKDIWSVTSGETTTVYMQMSAIEYYRNTLSMANYKQEVAFYKDGVTYYTAYVRHFDEDETPLPEAYEGDEATKDLTDLKNTDLTAENGWDKCVGRYGVLRNNSYQIYVSKVSGFGSPTIPTPPNEPDDKEDPKNYNAIVDINVLNWAKRGHDYTIK